MTPGDVSFETMPLELTPEVLIVPAFVITLSPGPLTALPFVKIPGALAPVVVIVPLLTSVSLFVCAAMPAEPSPVVESWPLLVSVPPPGLAKSCIAMELLPLVWMMPVVSLSIVTAAALLNMPSDSLPVVTIKPRLVSAFCPAPVPCAEMPSNVSPVTRIVPRLVIVLRSYTRMPLSPLTSSSAPVCTFTATLVLPVTAAIGPVDGLGAVLLHVTVWPLTGAVLSQAANAGSHGTRSAIPSADERASSRRKRTGTCREHARRIR